MIVATFNASTGWAGKNVTYEAGQFVLEEHGPVTREALLDYDAKGQIDWAYDGLRGWVQNLEAQAAPAPAATPAQPAAAAQQAVEPKPKKRRKLVWIGVGILVLFIIFIAIGAALDSGSPSSDSTTAVVTAPTPPPASSDTSSSTSSGGGGSSEPTAGQSNALQGAQDYLDTQAFSRAGLIQQLSSKWGEGYGKKNAIWAVNHVKVNWNEQAYLAAKQYLDTSAFSRSGLIQQLESSSGEGFTHAQAVYGATKALSAGGGGSSSSSSGGGDSSGPTAGQSNALKSAEQYISMQAFSRAGLISQLSSKFGEGYSKSDATWAVDHLKVNWNEQAYKAAKQYLDMGGFSRSGLIEQLESSSGEGFTHAQAVYGVNKAGL